MKSLYNTPRVLFTCHSEDQSMPDCDCACTPALSPASPWPETVTLPYHTAPSRSIAQHNNWHIYHNSLGSAAVVVLNPSAQALWQRFASPTLSNQVTGTDPQAREAISTLIQVGMLRPFEETGLVTNASTTLGAWLHVAGRCNLACIYCYIQDKTTEPTLATLKSAVDATLRSATGHGYSNIHLKYSGGEPLLRFPLLLETHRYAQTQAARLGKTLDAIVLSNGTLLTAAMVDQLRAADLRLMISLDGLGETHDRQRHYADGRGSFEDVARAVDLAQASGLEPLISITITRRNAQNLPEVIAWILERELPFSLNLYRESDCADPGAGLGLELEEENVITGMLAAYKVIERNLPRRSLLGALTDRANFTAPHCHTCSVGQDYLVFDAQGRVSKCQMDMAHPVTDINDPDPLATIRLSTTGLQNPSVEDKDECKECQWRYWCGGGCPLITYRATGRYTAKSPYCNIYKAIFPEIIRLEGLRLIKYANVLSE